MQAPRFCDRRVGLGIYGRRITARWFTDDAKDAPAVAPAQGRRPPAQAAMTTGSSSMRVVYRGERISNLVDHVRSLAHPADAGTTAPRPKRELQASNASMRRPPISRSSPPMSARCEDSRGMRSVVTMPAFE